jgi:hypothetical protein
MFSAASWRSTQNFLCGAFGAPMQNFLLGRLRRTHAKFFLGALSAYVCKIFFRSSSTDTRKIFFGAPSAHARNIFLGASLAHARKIFFGNWNVTVFRAARKIFFRLSTLYSLIFSTPGNQIFQRSFKFFQNLFQSKILLA